MNTIKSIKKLKREDGISSSEKHYIDMQISYYFNRLELKIADTKSEILNWFIKMFIGQLTGFIGLFIALVGVIRG